VSVLESKQTLLNPDVAASHYTLLLVDMSGSVSGSKDMPIVVEAARSFTERIQKIEKVAVYGFDGDARIHPVASFGAAGSAADAVAKMADVPGSDPSTNLNGAIIEAIKVLQGQLRSAPTPLKFGTLVVFTDGTDRAHRVAVDQLYKELDAADLDIIAIGVGEEIDGAQLERIGRNGVIASKNRKDIAAGFDRAAARVEAFSKRYYLLGYCSPSRAGKHVVRVEADGKAGRGAIDYTFDASGFGVPCDPTRPPTFNVHNPRPRVVPAKDKEHDRPSTGGHL
jgi:hypothetical protein